MGGPRGPPAAALATEQQKQANQPLLHRSGGKQDAGTSIVSFSLQLNGLLQRVIPGESPTSEVEGRQLCPRWGRKPPRFQCYSERERHPSSRSRPHQVQKCLWVGPGDWTHRSAGVPGRVTETRVSVNARGDAGKPGSQAGPWGHEATTVRVTESRQARGLAQQFCRASEHGVFRRVCGCVLGLGRGHTPVLSPKANLCNYFTTSHGVLWAR